MTKVDDLHRKWSADAAYRAAYSELANEYAIAEALIRARARAGLSQTEVAKRMKTSQSYVARLEGGEINPRMSAIMHYAKAVHAALKIEISPKPNVVIVVTSRLVNPATGARKRSQKARSRHKPSSTAAVR
jgi:transcriptional regulator with XRE-family HTH domain